MDWFCSSNIDFCEGHRTARITSYSNWFVLFSRRIIKIPSELLFEHFFFYFSELLPLQPLPVTALQNPEFEALYKFTHFNPIQTQIFHCLYHTNNNVLLGAPTGSGKTIVAEIAFFKVFKEDPNAKVHRMNVILPTYNELLIGINFIFELILQVVYIAPLKALVKERMRDWKVRFQKKLKKEVVELTGIYFTSIFQWYVYIPLKYII